MNTLRIGLTGGIGCGKSLVATIFERIFDIPCYNCDQKAKMLMVQDADLKQNIISIFGPQAYVSDELNRKFIADLIFADHQLKTALEAVVHPAVERDFLTWADRCPGHNKIPYILKESAILFESRADQGLDATIGVCAPVELRISRVMARDFVTPSINITDDQKQAFRQKIMARINMQMSDDQLTKLTTYSIRNNDQELLIPQIITVHNSLSKLFILKS